jgi:hypothetical protein
MNVGSMAILRNGRPPRVPIGAHAPRRMTSVSARRRRCGSCRPVRWPEAHASVQTSIRRAPVLRHADVDDAAARQVMCDSRRSPAGKSDGAPPFTSLLAIAVNLRRNGEYSISAMPWSLGQPLTRVFQALALDQVAAVEQRTTLSPSVPLLSADMPLVVRLMSLVRRPQQVEQRADASGPAEIMDDVEGPADGVVAEPAERGEGAKLGVDVVPGDAELA